MKSTVELIFNEKITENGVFETREQCIVHCSWENWSKVAAQKKKKRKRLKRVESKTWTQ